MNEKKKLQPKVRFREFTGENAPDWEQRKFNEIFTKSIINNTLSRADLTYDKGGIKNIHYGDILTKFDYCISSNDFCLPSISKDDDFVSQDELLENGDIVIADTAEDYTTGKTIEIVDSTNKIVAGLHTMAFRPNTKFASGYLGYYFNSIPYRKQLIKYIQGIKVLSISKSNINKTILTFTTNYDEQLLISKLLSNVEKLITLHQRKLEQLEQLKNTLLSKMFPKSGTNIPKIRFSGFTDTWKQRQLGEFAKITTGKLDANAMVNDGDYDFYTSGIKKYKIDTYAFEGPAITIAGNGATVGYMHLADGKFNAYQRTYVLTKFLADRNFLYNSIRKNLPKKIQQESRTGNIPYIVMEMLTQLTLKLPCQKEQETIGYFFVIIDNTIAIHQRKLEQLKNLKQTLLNKMFI